MDKTEYPAHKAERSDSVTARIKEAQASGDIPLPPLGVKINSKEAKILWEQYTSTRDEWIDPHLIHLSKIVHLEIAIRQQSKIMATEEYVITTRLGELKENPRLAAIDRLVKQQGGLTRLIGLNVNNDEAAKYNRKTKKPTAGRKTDKQVDAKTRLRGKLLGINGGKSA